jgi:RNA polymerase sigma factor (sigma-70 family)
MYGKKFHIMKITEENIPDLIRKQQDRQVIGHLYEELFPTVKNYIRKHNGRVEDAYDVFQDAIVYFYRQVVSNTFDEKYTVYGYVYRIAINRWINKLNKDKRMVFQTEISEEMARDYSYSNLGEDPETTNKDKNIITRFVSTIGERCVELMTFRIYSDLMFEDIMIRMGFSSEAATKMFFKRCRAKLAEAIKANPVLADQLRER